MGTHPIFESDFDCLTDEAKMRLTLFISILTCLIMLPCWLVMNHLKPPLNEVSPGTFYRAALGFAISLIIRSLARDKLTDDGHVAAIITGTLLTAASPVFIVAIIAFFVTSSKLTHYKADQKRCFDPDHNKGHTRRNAINVICNGGVSCALSIIYVAVQREPVFKLSVPRDIDASWLFLAILGSVAGAAADTWASEVGSVLLVSNQKRKAKEEDVKREKLVMCRLIVWPMKRVPRGTNGGVSMGGLVASAVGAFVVACVSLATLLYTKGLSWDSDEERLLIKVFVASLTVSGFMGSVIDSILGALFQYSGQDVETRLIVSEARDGVRHIAGMDVLDNHGVNILMSTTSALFGPLFFSVFYGYLR